jgi:hypothetical protein
MSTAVFAVALAETDGRPHGPPMVRAVRILALAALALGVAGCGGGARDQAAKGAARFLDAVHAGDRVAFEAAIDRPTVREDLRRQMTELARGNGLDVGGGPSDLALDRMIAPQAFRLVDARTGQPLPEAPDAARAAATMRILDNRHACLLAQQRCILTFGRSHEGWRLVSMQANVATIPVG